MVQTRRLTGSEIDEAFVDKGYRGHGEETTTVYLPGQKRGVKTRSLRARQKRRQVIEPIIGHLKSDGRMGRNYLQGTDGDAINLLLCCAGHKLRLILRRFRIFWLPIWQTLPSWLSESRPMAANGVGVTTLALNYLLKCLRVGYLNPLTRIG